MSDTTLSAEQRSALFEGGYIYGRSMNPVQLYGTLRGVQRPPEEQNRRLLYAASRLERLFPTVDRNLIYWLLGGAAEDCSWGSARWSGGRDADLPVLLRP